MQEKHQAGAACLPLEGRYSSSVAARQTVQLQLKQYNVARSPTAPWAPWQRCLFQQPPACPPPCQLQALLLQPHGQPPPGSSQLPGLPWARHEQPPAEWWANWLDDEHACLAYTARSSLAGRSMHIHEVTACSHTHSQAEHQQKLSGLLTSSRLVQIPAQWGRTGCAGSFLTFTDSLL